jgi:hypothetical protein
MLTLLEIRTKIEQLAKQINAPADLLPTYGTSKNIGDPFIYVDNAYYYYLAYERDVKTTNKQTSNSDELLYWVFESVTDSMAASFELANRSPNSKEDFRRVMFAHQLELLGKLSVEWKKKREKEILEILNRSPYLT